MNANDRAFPFACQGPTTGPEFYYSLTKREYFAALAMQGICSNPSSCQGKDFDDTCGQVARVSVAVADALIIALGK